MDKHEGRFVRPTAAIRNWITPDGAPGPTGEGGFKAEAGRYRLYVALICPWASRALIARALKGLTEIIPVSIVDPRLTDQGWRFATFPGSTEDPLYGSTYLHELYTRSDASYTGRVTVPVLWDTKTETIVNNESSDILKMFDTAFGALTGQAPSLRPERLEAGIEYWNDHLYSRLNNGVYRAGFATTQAAYNDAVSDVFEALDTLEERLSERRFMFGDRPTETDWRIFVTLVRFDDAYHGLFKCNRKRVADYPALSAYMERLLEVEGIADTVDLGHIRAGYYNIRALNPSAIVPIGPAPAPALHRVADTLKVLEGLPFGHGDTHRSQAA